MDPYKWSSRPADLHTYKHNADTGCRLEDLSRPMGRMAREIQGTPCSQYDLMIVTTKFVMMRIRLTKNG